jgi:NAD(P)-dependent dehydrogenase (short-subunit alcohol dehydrogenase family)
VIRTNLNGAFFTVNSAAPLLNDSGSIILNGSVHSYLANLGSPHMQPPRVVSSRWRERSPQILHRATFA